MDTDAVLTLLQDVAEEFINPRFQSLTAEQVIEKGPGDLVTVADREAEVAITQALRSAYPDAVILGEEASAADSSIVGRYRSAEHAFTIDPIDGTNNFVHGSPDHAVMVAELWAGQCVRSWIWQPQNRRAYVAEKGAGMWRDGGRLHRTGVSAAPEGIRAVTSMRPWLGEALGDIPPLELTWVCCGVDYPRLIEGAADVILYGGTFPWDHAPGTLMVSEAGGYVGTFQGTAYDPREQPSGIVVCGDRSTYDLILPLVADLPGR